ncbi:hypothetical protein TrVFT333_009490 [Trichoderma virens FT-333]|nr:hypothetical protein TrVFT333_009490 [Trichoderma virens FT-333]
MFTRYEVPLESTEISFSTTTGEAKTTSDEKVVDELKTEDSEKTTELTVIAGTEQHQTKALLNNEDKNDDASSVATTSKDEEEVFNPEYTSNNKQQAYSITIDNEDVPTMYEEENLLPEGISPPTRKTPHAGRQARTSRRGQGSVRAVLALLKPVAEESDTNATIETVHPLVQTLGLPSTEISEISKLQDEIPLLVKQAKPL